MANNRMAGEELDKDNPVAEEAKNAVAEAEENKSLSDRYGQDYVDKVKVDGLQDGKKYSRKELAAEFRYGRGDTSVDDTVAGYQSMVDSGEFKGNNQAQEFLKMHGVNFGGNEETDPTPVEETPVITPDPVETIPTPTPEKPNPIAPTPGIVGPGNGQIVNQDNDINSTIRGDGNTVNIGQDNSVNQQQASLEATNLMDNYVLNLRKSKATI
jgi:hypothetical protein